MTDSPSFKVNISRSFKDDKKALKNISKAIGEADSLVLKVIENPDKVGEHFRTLKPNLVIKYLKFGHNPEYRIMFAFYDCANSKVRRCLARNVEEECSIEPFKCLGIVDLFAFKTKEECNNYYHQLKDKYKVIENS